MSEWTVHLELEEGTSGKFWRARVDGKTLYINQGTIGSAGQTQVKELGDPASAAKEYDKLVREKRKEGYIVGGGGAGELDDDDSDEDEGSADDEDESPKIRVPKVAPPPPPRTARPAPPARRPAGAMRYVLETPTRTVETFLWIDGTMTIRVESLETYASADATRKAFDQRKKALAAEGYKPR